jgi:hypothetical protein
MTKSQSTECAECDSMPACESCRWWSVERQADIGDCRLRPPLVIAFDDWPNTVFPSTDRSNWCGEFKCFACEKGTMEL